MSRKKGAAAGSGMADQLAELAGHLNDQDRALCRLLADHQVLTSHQIAQLLYSHTDAVPGRLALLTQLRVVDRFRPLTRVGGGSAPYHYVLGGAGAAVLAAEQGVDPGQLGFRRGRALAGAHAGGVLARLLAVNGVFAALAAAARTRPGAELVRWWSARCCADQWGTVVRPAAYGHWREATPTGAVDVDFFLEHDPPGSRLDRLAVTLAGYHDLALGSGIATPVLLWLASPDHETL